MKLIERRIRRQPERLGLFPGSFNPPTSAHLALARAALRTVDEVLFVVPAVFPHKRYEGATLEQRIEMLSQLARQERRFTVAVSERGLFIDIANEAREHFDASELFVLCGRDAAERIVNWDYGEPGAIEKMLQAFRLAVAPRQGVYAPPAHLAHAVLALDGVEFDECSATAVREAIAGGQEWQPLVPPEIADMVRRVYGTPVQPE